jgi:hypothetical protein
VTSSSVYHCFLKIYVFQVIFSGPFLYTQFSYIAKMNQQQDVQPEDPANPGLNGQQNHGHLHKVIEALESQIGQMAEEAKAQKALEKLHLQTIAALRAIVEKQQANGVSAEKMLFFFQYLLKIFNINSHRPAAAGHNPCVMRAKKWVTLLVVEP